MMAGESYQPGRSSLKPSEMEGYGYGDEGGGFGSSFNAPGMNTNSQQTDKKPTSGIFGAFSIKSYLESTFTDINYNLLISKTFYFFFFAAFGSLFPLIAVYFKQLGMNPAQTGILIGFRPFVEILAGPFWGYIAEKWQKFKEMLLFALFCWVAFTLALAFIQPTASSCLEHNGTHITVTQAWVGSDRTKRSLDANYDLGFTYDNGFEVLHRAKRMDEIMDGTVPEDKLPSNNKTTTTTTTTKLPSTSTETPVVKTVKPPPKTRYLPHPNINDLGRSPLPLDHKDIANLDEIDVRGLVSPPLSAVVYKQKDINSVFVILLILMIIGEFVSSPAIALADAATLGYLGDKPEEYGKHRMLGSVGWAISMFIVGIALDHSNIFPNHPCGTEQLVDRNYTVCFAIFSVLMSCAFLTATQFKFAADTQQTIQLDQFKNIKGTIQHKIVGKQDGDIEQLAADDDDRYDRYVDPNKTGTTNPHPAYAAYSQDRKLQISLQGQDGGSMITDATTTEPGIRASPFTPRGKPGQIGTLPEWMTVMRLLATPQHMSSLFILWYMGFGIGLVFAFLFWHLQDLHGTPTLFGLASVINHISEILAFFFSRKLINRFGHVRVLYAGLVGNVIRFMYISWLRNPWWVLPFELTQGLTHAAVWATGCSYVVQTIPSNHRLTAQGILTAVHHGLGRGCGAIIGGAFINSFGSENTFRGCGIATLIVLGGYIALYNFFIKIHMPQDAPQGEGGDEAAKDVMEETHLAPYGVPMSSMAHSLSGSKLNEPKDRGGGYGTAGNRSTNGFLDPGPTQASGYGYDQSGPISYQNQYSIKLPAHLRRGDGQQEEGSESRPQANAGGSYMTSQAPAPSTQLHFQQPENRHKTNDLF